ncbi:glycoside hydrolase family 36 protein [Botrytis cinerea T4]|uniref:Glycoside hydrolase family 36 protein n=1 Tax=Botryotinia fuckeliana (strain T4) TaxID=999810 RepID=G2Y923_BOTF4|nr:glycoside hydrolase family 36 protein [Botrytis cinerea T4]
MTAQVICYPLLGQTTVIAEKQVNITVALSPDNDEETNWEAALWYGSEDMSWKQLDLARSDDHITIFAAEPKNSVLFFTNTLQQQSLNGQRAFYTIKYRKSGDSTWKWVNDDPNPVGNAEIIFQSATVPSSSIEEYISSLSVDLHVEYNGQHGASNSPVWTLKYPIHAPVASATESSIRRTTIGFPKHVVRYFALVKRMNFWLVPRHGISKFDLGEDDCQFYTGNTEPKAILVSFLTSDGMNFVMLALSMNGVVTMLTSGENGSIEFVGKNENEQQRDGTIICAVGKTVEEGITAVMDHAKKVVQLSLNTEPITSGKLERSLASKDQKSFHDELVYCTWNSLGPTLTSTTLLAALDDLGNSSIYPSTIIIDDGWQSTTPFGSETFPNQHRWSRFEASSTSFPEGLGDLSLRIRKSYPWIRNIGVWHGIFGYWGGIEPESEIGRKYKLRWVEINNTRRSGMWVIDVCDVRRFYDDFYSFLVDSGINAVKLDTQGLLDDLKNAKDRRELIPAYQDAIHASLLSHFEDRVISCMSQYPANIFSPQILLSSSAHPANKIAMRNSDDFWPNDPATHAWHIHTNSHTAHLTTHLENIIPDWDMFQTSSQTLHYSSYHAAARALSGGLLSITDTPSHHDTSIISRLSCTPFPSSLSSTPSPPTILHTHPAKSTSVYPNSHSPRTLKLQTSTLQTNIKVLGLFNPFSSHSLTEIIGLEDFFPLSHSLHSHREDPTDEHPETQETGNQYIIHSSSNNQLSPPISLHSRGTNASRFIITLPESGWEILTACRVYTIPLPLPATSLSNPDSRTISISIIGLLEKFIGAAAIIKSSFSISSSTSPPTTNRSSPPLQTLHLHLQLQGTGILGLFLSSPSPSTPPPQISSLHISHLPLSHLLPQHTKIKHMPHADGYMVSIDLSSILDSSSSSNHGFDSHSHSQSGSTVVEDGGEFDGLRMFDSGDEDGDGEGVVVDIGILV